MYEVDARKHGSAEEAADYVDCHGCDAHIERSAAYPCSGSDTCTARFCEGCVNECTSCSLPACCEHLTDFCGDLWCSLCMDAYVADQRDAMAVVAMARQVIEGRAS